ncbi:hypothetical protein PCASD_12803, partial [Puccinia coronata f. sp. avenae]
PPFLPISPRKSFNLVTTIAKVSPCLTIIIQPTNQPEPAPTCVTIMIQPTNTFAPTLAITIPPTDQNYSHLGQHQQSRIPSHFPPSQPRHDQAYCVYVAVKFKITIVYASF